MRLLRIRARRAKCSRKPETRRLCRTGTEGSVHSLYKAHASRALGFLPRIADLLTELPDEGGGHRPVGLEVQRRLISGSPTLPAVTVYSGHSSQQTSKLKPMPALSLPPANPRPGPVTRAAPSPAEARKIAGPSRVTPDSSCKPGCETLPKRSASILCTVRERETTHLGLGRFMSSFPGENITEKTLEAMLT